MVEVDHFVAVVATRHVHYPFVLRPVSAYRFITRIQGLEFVMCNDWVPLWHVILVIHNRDQILQFEAFVVLGVNSEERSPLVVLATTIFS